MGLHEIVGGRPASLSKIRVLNEGKSNNGRVALIAGSWNVASSASGVVGASLVAGSLSRVSTSMTVSGETDRAGEQTSPG
jgi:hypothetical protein